MAQPFQPSARHARVGILDRRHGAGDPGGDQRLGAGGGLPVMGAGLEADIGSAAAGARPSLGQRL